MADGVADDSATQKRSHADFQDDASGAPSRNYAYLLPNEASTS